MQNTLSRTGRTTLLSLSSIAAVFAAALMFGIADARAVNIAPSGTGTIGFTSDPSLTGTENDHNGSNTYVNDNNIATRVDDWPFTTNDYVGVTFSQPITGVYSVGLVMSLFVDGGWFGPSNTSPGAGNPLAAADLTAPTVQVTTDGIHWSNIPSTSDYVSVMTGIGIGGGSFPNPNTSPLSTFNVSVTTGIEGIRLIGNGGGVAGLGGFIGVSELYVNVPEPGSFPLFGLGAIGLVAAARSARRRPSSRTASDQIKTAILLFAVAAACLGGGQVSFADQLAPPSGIDANEYHLPFSGSYSSTYAFNVSTDGNISTSGTADSFDTYNGSSQDGVHSPLPYAGLTYSASAVFTRVDLYIGFQYGNGGNFASTPNVYILTNPAGATTDPVTDTTNWSQVTSGHFVSDPISTSPGVQGSAYEYDFAGNALPNAYGWALGGVSGYAADQVDGGFISITEMQGFATPEPSTLVLAGVARAGTIGSHPLRPPMHSGLMIGTRSNGAEALGGGIRIDIAMPMIAITTSNSTSPQGTNCWCDSAADGVPRAGIFSAVGFFYRQFLSRVAAIRFPVVRPRCAHLARPEGIPLGNSSWIASSILSMRWSGLGWVLKNSGGAPPWLASTCMTSIIERGSKPASAMKCTPRRSAVSSSVRPNFKLTNCVTAMAMAALRRLLGSLGSEVAITAAPPNPWVNLSLARC